MDVLVSRRSACDWPAWKGPRSRRPPDRMSPCGRAHKSWLPSCRSDPNSNRTRAITPPRRTACRAEFASMRHMSLSKPLREPCTAPIFELGLIESRTSRCAITIGNVLQVFVRDNNVEQALRVLKKKMQREGIFREMKRRRFYEKPSEQVARQKSDAVRRARKAARKQAQREGLIPMPKKREPAPRRAPPRF